MLMLHRTGLIASVHSRRAVSDGNHSVTKSSLQVESSIPGKPPNSTPHSSDKGRMRQELNSELRRWPIGYFAAFRFCQSPHVWASPRQTCLLGAELRRCNGSACPILPIPAGGGWRHSPQEILFLSPDLALIHSSIWSYGQSGKFMGSTIRGPSKPRARPRMGYWRGV
jgi:hypothetical protein